MVTNKDTSASVRSDDMVHKANFTGDIVYEKTTKTNNYESLKEKINTLGKIAENNTYNFFTINQTTVRADR